MLNSSSKVIVPDTFTVLLLGQCQTARNGENQRAASVWENRRLLEFVGRCIHADAEERRPS